MQSLLLDETLFEMKFFKMATQNPDSVYVDLLLLRLYQLSN